VKGRQDMRSALRRMRDAMKAASAELKCPAAEVVPAMPAAWEILDKALAE
jgi:hypothetical protein